MTWSEDMHKYAEYFIQKFHDQDDWWKPESYNDTDYWPDLDDSIHSLFKKFAEFADPPKILNELDSYIKSAKSAADYVNSRFCDPIIAGMDVYLDYWHGDTADNFKLYMDEDVRSALAYKWDRITALSYALQAYKKAITAYQRDVLKFIDVHKKVVEDGDAKNREIGLALAASVVSVGVAAVTAGAGSTMLVTLAVGDVLSNGASSVSQIEIEDGSYRVEDYIGMMPGEADPLFKAAREQLDFVIKSFGKLQKGIETGTPKMLPKRPGLVTDDRFDPEKFHNDDQSKEDLDSVSREDLVQDNKDPRDDYDRDRNASKPFAQSS